jgi:hypothetical protein
MTCAGGGASSAGATRVGPGGETRPASPSPICAVSSRSAASTGRAGTCATRRHETSRPAVPLSGAATAPRPHATAQVMDQQDAHLRDQEAETRADTFLQGALRDEGQCDVTPKAS